MEKYLTTRNVIILVVILIIAYCIYCKMKRKPTESTPVKESTFNNKLRQEVQSEVEVATAPRPTGNDVYDTMVMRG